MKESTVGVFSLIILATVFPICVIVAVELINYPWKDEPPGFKRIIVFRVLSTSGQLLLAHMILFTMGNIVKGTLGELGPYFLEACRPNVNCSDPAVYSHFIKDYTCSGDKKTINQARKTFPSGHASIITLSMVYICLYVEVKLKLKWFFLGKIFTQFLFMCIAVFVGISRVVDFQHHWVDIFVGFWFGMTYGVGTAYNTKLFLRHQDKSSKGSESTYSIVS
ncbi:phospholipid phosphatase 1-like [Cimex lectularius]|uniref:Phosphatidic acid phosphatase type 2/haloperoxidase domain-containing protein n=1 Tax=Cimex lectularius TaxID=79782 RepID=A0A8I6SNN6_CIMLE|nr:phospholipid phosphatase 1-like [Cimex lectularius]